MLSHRGNAYISSAVTAVLIAAFVLTPHDESIVDLFFLGMGIISSVLTVSLIKKHRAEKRMRSY